MPFASDEEVEESDRLMAEQRSLDPDEGLTPIVKR